MDHWFRKAIVVSALAIVGSAQAQITNGSFENAYSNWTTIGDTLILDSGLGSGPTHGTFDAFMASATDGTVNPNVGIGSGVSAASVESFLNLNSGSLSSIGH